MARNNTNRVEVPQAKEALNRMKYEVASSLGINLNPGYNGNLSTYEAGKIGGNMVKQMIHAAEQSLINQTVSSLRTAFQQGLAEAQQEFVQTPPVSPQPPSQ
ncbi:MAG: alpha/beta-type small acid-soluble spore protein [Firmicutes bacterium]|nr:alpha/beta-type small acid-soluble spore protein [Bacillota bacterium]